MKYLRVRKHDEFQHYKDRHPPWIKLHQDCLSSYNFIQLPDNIRWQALGLALIASRCDNHLPADPKFLKEAIHSTTTVDIDRLIQAEFLVWCNCSKCVEQVASKSLAGCKQSACLEESREEKRRGEERNAASAAHRFAEFWSVYPRKVGKRKAESAFKSALTRDLPGSEELAAIIEQQAAGWDDPKFIPYPTTWLNRDGWTDEPPAPKRLEGVTTFERDTYTPPPDQDRQSAATFAWGMGKDLGVKVDTSGESADAIIAAYESATGRTYADDLKTYTDNGSLQEAS